MTFQQAVPFVDPSDPACAAAAAEILRIHDAATPEANITAAVRSFLVATGLAQPDEIVQEEAPALGSRHAVDLKALDTFMEFKRRLGAGQSGLPPNPQHVTQLDGYLTESQTAGHGVRMGVLTDGKHWLLRWPGAGDVRITPPYAFTLDNADRWYLLYEWLRDHALIAREGVAPDRETIINHFGPNSPQYERDIDVLNALYDRVRDHPSVRLKRRLWHDLLRTALGEIARTDTQMDDLFVRHTYLTEVIGIVVQASFGIDIRAMAANDPADLAHGRTFQSQTGLKGVVESDFFAWPAEVDGAGAEFLRTLARRIARFDWRQAPPDVAAVMYETVIPSDERRQLGEYYTPRWLARAMVRELVADPARQRVLDPACGSGTFLAEAVTHFIGAARASGDFVSARDILNKLRDAVVGIDVHPVAVHLARAAWVLAAQPVINETRAEGFADELSAPVYLGDALQLRFRTGDMFAERDVTIQVGDDDNTELIFPVSLVERAETFDAVIGDAARAIEEGGDPIIALDDNHITDPGERATLTGAIETLRTLHNEGRNHIWAYYTRNLVRPVALARHKVDVVIGNPPWINYNRTVDTLRAELVSQSKDMYGIWAGGRHATNQDVASLFFARSVDLYLKDGGVIGMVLPHSALQSGQHTKWRTGRWESKPVGRGLNRAPGRALSVNFSWKTAWDLEKLEPNTFFPVPASVAFATRVGTEGAGSALAGHVERWIGKAGAPDNERVRVPITDTSAPAVSPYDAVARRGADIYPRGLMFVEETENPTTMPAGQTITVNPRRGTQDKRPWRDLDLTAITGQTIEAAHVYDVHLGETVVPYATLDALTAVLPVRKGENSLPADPDGVGGIALAGLEPRMRNRWRAVNAMWEENKAAANNLNLVGQMDYYGKLSAQLEWQRDHGDRPVRVIQTEAGQPAATLLVDDNAIVDTSVYWIACEHIQEAHYLLAIINSQTLYEAVMPLMAKGQFGARHLHKHLWDLPIPAYSEGEGLHRELASAGEAASVGVARELSRLREERGREGGRGARTASGGLTVTIARRELRAWLRRSKEGAEVERLVGRLLGGGR